MTNKLGAFIYKLISISLILLHTSADAVDAQADPQEQPGPSSTAQTRRAFLPRITGGFTCPTTSGNSYDLTQFVGSPYKNNALTDENADFRLSILGYAATTAPLQLIDYGATPGGDAPRLQGIFEPSRLATFVQAYRVYHWNWNESLPPPYGSRGSVNTDWPVTVLDLRTTTGENIYIPERNANITPAGHKAMVLYAGPRELTLVYLSQDQVVVNGTGYVVHLLNFCVDPNLLALYRAQLDGTGRRATGHLPALPNDKIIGRALNTSITVAIRDAAAFMDPRATDWWPGLP